MTSYNIDDLPSELKVGYWAWFLNEDIIHRSKNYFINTDIHPFTNEKLICDWEESIHTDDREDCLRKLKKLIAGVSRQFESVHRIKSSKDRYVWVFERGVISNNSIGSVIFTTINIDNYYRIRDDSNKILANIPGALFQFDLISMVNCSVKFISCPPSNILLSENLSSCRNVGSIVELFADHSRRKVIFSFIRSLKTNKRISIDVELSGVNSGVWINLQATPEQLSWNRVTWHGYISDVSKVKEDYLSVNKLKNRYDLAMRATQIGIWEWDLSTSKVEWSDEAFSILGYDAAEFQVSIEKFKNLCHSHDYPAVMSEVKTQLERSGQFRTEFRLKNINGHWRWIEARGHFVSENKNHSSQKVIGTHIDITEFKEKQLNADCANFKYKVLLESKDYIVNHIYHDLRGNLQEAYDIALRFGDHSTSEVNKVVNGIAHRISLSLLTIEQLSRPDYNFYSNTIGIETTFSLNDLLRGILEDLSVRSGLDTSGIEIYSTLEDDIVICDQKKVSQIVNNTISHFLENSKMIDKISLHYVNTGEMGRHVHLAFDGSKSNLTKRESSVLDGRNIHLLVANRVLSILRGSNIVVTGESSDSTCISFDFPVRVPTRLQSDQFIKRNISNNHTNFDNKKVLIVDDVCINRELMARQLGELGLSSEHACNGQEAIDIFIGETNYDWVMMDIMMPVLNGIEAARYIRQINKDVPIIALSGDMLQHTQEELQSAGFTAYLQKPLNRSQIFHTLVKFKSHKDSIFINQGIVFKKNPRNFDSNELKVAESLFSDQPNLFYDLLKDLRTYILDVIIPISDRLEQFALKDINPTMDFMSLAHDHLHSLKGTSANIGLSELSQACGLLDEQVRLGYIPMHDEVKVFNIIAKYSLESISSILEGES